MPIQPIPARRIKRAVDPVGDREVYNPGETEQEFRYAAKPYKLPAKSSVTLPALVALHAEDVLGVWGVKVVASPEDKAEADKAYVAAMDNWSAEVLVAAAEDIQKRVAAGVPLPDTPDIRRAKEWFDRKAH